jgi:hypothetical protein
VRGGSTFSSRFPLLSVLSPSAAQPVSPNAGTVRADVSTGSHTTWSHPQWNPYVLPVWSVNRPGSAPCHVRAPPSLCSRHTSKTFSLSLEHTPTFEHLLSWALSSLPLPMGPTQSHLLREAPQPHPTASYSAVHRRTFQYYIIQSFLPFSFSPSLSPLPSPHPWNVSPRKEGPHLPPPVSQS